MSGFESEDAYREFARVVRTERRWIFDGKAKTFLFTVRAACRSRLNLLKAGSRLFRAQLGSVIAERPKEVGSDEMSVEEEHPLPEERMVPDAKHIQRSNRANAPGFPFLYLATNERTAIAEMRPWVGESVTLAIFETQRDLKLVVCKAGVEDLEQRLFEENPSAEKLDDWVWNDISRAFARPVSREDREFAYIPTQILAEAFKAEGFDGLAYRSGLERGTNVVLFDVHTAKPIQPGFVYAVRKVRYDCEAAPNYAIYRIKDGKGECLTEIHTESPD